MPDGWRSLAPAKWNSRLGECLNRSRDDWSVALSDTSPRVVVTRHLYAAVNDTLRVGNGMLVGWNQGEFGGGVVFIPASGIADTLVRDNLRAFVPSAPGVRAIVGLAHLSLDEGAIYALVPRGPDSWQASRVADLGSAPLAVLPLPGDSLLVLTSRRLVIVTPDNRVQLLVSSENWWPLYANSVVRDRRGNIIVGMRGAIAHLRPTARGYHETWYAQGRCRGGLR